MILYIAQTYRMNKTNRYFPNLAAWRSVLLQYAGLLIALLVLIIAFGLKTDHFLSLTTLRTISNQIPDAVLLAVGMIFVMIVGGIDLSVGSAEESRAHCRTAAHAASNPLMAKTTTLIGRGLMPA